MVRSIIIVAVLLIGLCYVAFFLMWNADAKVNLVTWGIGGDPFWIEAVPVAFLPLLGAVIGALVMAIAAWLPWANQRAATKAAESKVQKVIQKFNEQKGILNARNERIAELEEQLDDLQAEETPPGDTSAEQESSEPPQTTSTDAEQEGDAEVI